MKLIDKDSLVAEIEKKLSTTKKYSTEYVNGKKYALKKILSFIDSLEVVDPYEQLIQYASIESGIKAHAEVYSFNIESELFNQLTKEQQALWRREIEQACISGGYNGLDLAKDPRYKENTEVKDVDLDKEVDDYINEHFSECDDGVLISDANSSELTLLDITPLAKHFFELGLKAYKGE